MSTHTGDNAMSDTTPSLWDTAQTAARDVIDNAFAQARAELATLKAALAEKEAQLAACEASHEEPEVPTTTDTFGRRLVKHVKATIPGLVHAYAMDAPYLADDLVGYLDGSMHGGVTFTDRAYFDGTGHIEIPNDPSLSVATTGALTIVANVAITDWRGNGGNGEYIHWAGKGEAGAHEYAFRHYVRGGSGEAAQRQGRVSFYHFNPSGGLGAGSYVQDARMPMDAHWYAGACSMHSIRMWRDGELIDSDLLSSYSIAPKHGSAPLRIGTRDGSGHLVGSVGPVLIFDRILTADEHAAIASFT